MLQVIPTPEELKEHMGDKAFAVWEEICAFVHATYKMDTLWNKGGKNGLLYEHKFRKGGKTLCALYVKEGCFGFMVIYGKAEREKFEAQRTLFSKEIQSLYDGAKTYHDGKWIMIEIADGSYLEECKQMLLIKRNPPKK